MDSDAELVHRLRSGDEHAFTGLVERYHQPMLQLAASFVPNLAVAEEVVQDTWLAVLRGLDGFEGSGGWADPPEHWIEAAEGRIEAHLSGCPHCTEYLAQMRETIKLTGQLTPEDLTPQMRDEFTDLYRRWRSEQQ